MKTIALAGTFDTKDQEFLYVKGLIETLGIRPLTIHTGVFEPLFEPDVSNREVVEAAGYDLNELVKRHDRAQATKAIAEGMEILIPRLYQEGKFDGILSFGGSGGTSLATAAMRALPIGVPKVMVSTMASGNVEQYVGTSDIVMIPSIVDVAGLNAISKTIFRNAVLAAAGMVDLKDRLPQEEEDGKPLVAATMFGVTTPCVEHAKECLENHGYEVMVFHATGTGGKTMEAMARSGYFKGILDLTTTEWCDQVIGGVLAAGEKRNEAASLCGIPQVVSVGAMDMVNFGPPDTVPEKFKGRKFYQHNPTVTLMRTTLEENIEIAQRLAGKLNLASGKTVLMLPLKGVSAIDVEGQPFYGPEEDAALFRTLKENVNRSVVEIEEYDMAINDPKFAEAAAKRLIRLMENN